MNKKEYNLRQAQISLAKKEYKEKMRRLAGHSATAVPYDDYETRIALDPQEEIKKAFTKMTNEQLQFQITIGGKNKEYAQALLNHRKKHV
jgi:hypothetical protein